MVIKPRVKGFICTTAHPTGCREAVKEQIDYAKAHPAQNGPKKVLVISASTGYGLATRIAAAFGCKAATIGVSFEKPASKGRTATAGWYNTAYFEEFAAKEGLYAKSIMGDAFSQEIKEQTAALIRADLGQVDMVIYSLAAPRRTLPDGTQVSSVLKTVGEPYTNKTIDLKSHTLSSVTIPPATPEEVADTVKVMGGEDWKDWLLYLKEEGLLSPECVTLAYSYIGPDITHPMYLDGSIGAAKRDLKRTADEMTQTIPGVRAYISVNKALVTQSSAAIPILPLYITALYRVMKEMGLHENCIQQMSRMFSEKLCASPVKTDNEGYVRMDDWELKEDVQEKVALAWGSISEDTLDTLCDIDGYWDDFYRMFGFGIDNVDYDAEVEPDVAIPSLS